jgi:hypothetical protein
LPRSSALRKIVRGCPCEVKQLLSGPEVDASDSPEIIRELAGWRPIVRRTGSGVRILAQAKALIADSGTRVRDLVANVVSSSALSSRHDPAVDPAAR